MSEKLGAITFQPSEEHVFLGREMTQSRDFSEHTARLIDEDVRTLIGDVEDKVQGLLNRERKKLESLANALCEAETLQADEVRRVLETSNRTRTVSAL
jgi:cell division protease FtsH